MASAKEFSAAEQARRDYQRSLTVQRGGQAELAAPVVPAILPGDPNGLLNANEIQSVLKVEIPAWPAPPVGESEYLWLSWAREEAPGADFKWDMVTVTSETEFPLQLEIPRRDYLQGRLLIKYETENWQGNPAASATTLVTLDTVPPYGSLSPESLDIPVEVITDAYLNQNEGKVVLTIPDYPADRAPGDQAFFFWVKDVPDEMGDIPPTLGPIDVNTSREIVVTRAILEAAGQGQCFGLYALVDKAGNVSRLSWHVTAWVMLGALPVVTDPPAVPLAFDGVVDRLDAFTGVVVQIPAFQNPRNGDLVHVTWGNTTLAVYPVGPNPSFPMLVNVPWDALKANYDFGSADSRQPVIVSYRVTRDTLPFPDAPLSTVVHVDFSVVGPENPDEPNPVNPGLALLSVKSASDRINELVPDDHGKPATVLIPLDASAKPGDVIKVYWDKDLAVDTYTVGPDDEPGDTVVEIAIPWEMIERHANNSELPVHYIMTDAGEVNYQESQVTHVDVKVLTITFEAPTFPHISVSPGGKRSLNCESIRQENGEHGFYVHVAPDGRHLKAGVRVLMEWRVTEYPNGTPSVPGTEFTEWVDITPEQEVNGITWFVHPYEDYILPAFSDTPHQAGITYVQYQVFLPDEVVASAPAQELVGLLAGNVSCPLNNKS